MKIKTISIATFAFIASLATFPYGYKFSFLFDMPHVATIAVGCLFAVTAGLANAILGFYSLSNIEFKQYRNIYLITSLAILGAVPTGFFSYFGYNKILPNSLNLTVSLIVLVVNAGINFTAIMNLIKSIKKITEPKSDPQPINVLRTVACVLGGIIGVLISITAYLATTNGITQIAIDHGMAPTSALYTGSFLAIIAWLPLGALYLNSMGVVTEKLYNFITKIKENIKKSTLSDFLLLAFVLLSGTAFARMVHDFYNPQNMIPEMFKTSIIQSIAYNCLMPLALIAAAAVNYFAFTQIIQNKKK